jgi:hypothetical protein
MNNIEDDLKAALRRRPAPAGFAAKVFERIENESVGRRIHRRLFYSPLRLLAAAAVIIVTVGAGIMGYQQYVRRRNDAALNRTMAALSIAATQLDEAHKKAFQPERWDRIEEQLLEIQSVDKK